MPPARVAPKGPEPGPGSARAEPSRSKGMPRGPCWYGNPVCPGSPGATVCRWRGSPRSEHMFVTIGDEAQKQRRPGRCHTPPVGSPHDRLPHETTRRDMAEERDKALDAALGQIEKQFGKGSIMRMGENISMNIESIPTGALSLDLALGHRRPAPGPHRGDLRTGVLGQVDPGHARGGRGAAQRRHLRLHRRRARHGPGVRRGHRGQRRRPAHLPARHRRAGPGDRRHADPLGCARRPGHRLGGGPDPAGRDRGRDGRHPRRPAGPPHVPGPAQADRDAVQVRAPSPSSSTSCGRRSA